MKTYYTMDSTFNQTNTKSKEQPITWTSFNFVVYGLIAGLSIIAAYNGITVSASLVALLSVVICYKLYQDMKREDYIR